MTYTVENEAAELLSALARHRGFLLHTISGINEDQARLTPTVSALSLGGLVKHVTATERQWVAFMLTGPAAFAWPGADDGASWESDGDADGEAEPADDPWTAGFRMTSDETVAGLLADYAQAALETEHAVRGLVSLDDGHPLPQAPWFEPGAVWSARRVLLHLIAETSQHAGHADIIRETIDGQKTMG